MEVESECAQLLCGLLVVDHDDGHLDDEELILLVTAVEFADARCLLLPLLEIPGRIDLSSLNDAECKLKFRFTRRQICCVHEALQVPDRFRLPCRQVWSGMEGFLVLLRRLCYPNRLDDLCREFGRSKAALSLIFNRMLVWIWERWGRLVTNPFQQPYFTQALLDDYSTTIGASTSIDLHVWGFIDGTVRPICRPSHDQRIFYNGHKRTHALKFQAVTAPDGLITHLFGPVEGRRHDSGVLGESGLLPQLAAHMNGPNGIPYALYGDAAYPLSPYLQKAYQGAALTQAQQRFNTKMNKARVAVEWSFGDISNQWGYLAMKKQQKVLLQPVAMYYRVAALLTNLRTIVRYGNEVSQEFSLWPPSLQEYLQ